MLVGEGVEVVGDGLAEGFERHLTVVRGPPTLHGDLVRIVGRSLDGTRGEVIDAPLHQLRSVVDLERGDEDLVVRLEQDVIALECLLVALEEVLAGERLRAGDVHVRRMLLLLIDSDFNTN